jgi:N,N'-diacetylbacillosaminyl-diphospho-undecaprenol alpha-1,3-N-acetylgalactosaminyltransferase
MVNNQAFTLWQFRRGLIRELVARGHDVLLVSPGGMEASKDVERLLGLGARHAAVRLDPYVDPLGDLRFVWELTRLLRHERVDLVHNITIKVNILGTLAAKLAGVKRVVGLVPGLGYVYAERRGIWAWLLRTVVTAMYLVVFRLNDRVWVLNEDILKFLVGAGVLPRHKAVLTPGEGVDLEEYSPGVVPAELLAALRAELGLANTTAVVLMTARSYWSKGIRDYAAAAGRVKRDVVFLFAGATQGGPGAASAGELQELEREAGGRFRWLGFRTDVRELLALADVVALPSYYPEGVPRSLLEALATGKPIVTTDMPGGRETVEDGMNGYLVPPRDPAALGAAIDRLLTDPALRERFGAHSRRKAEQEFGERMVVERVIREVYGLPG